MSIIGVPFCEEKDKIKTASQKANSSMPSPLFIFGPKVKVILWPCVRKIKKLI
jgi:hypothetical protein